MYVYKILCLESWSKFCCNEFLLKLWIYKIIDVILDFKLYMLIYIIKIIFICNNYGVIYRRFYIRYKEERKMVWL